MVRDSPDDVFTFRDVIPRERQAYTATDHIMERIRMDGRFITEGLVRELIEGGTLQGNSPGRGGWLFVKSVEGVEVKLVCSIGPDLEARIVTGLSSVVDRNQAIKSERWGRHMVQQVELRKMMSTGENEVPDGNLHDIESPVPVDMKGHRVMTAHGWDYVKCTVCDLQSRAKSELAGTPCGDSH